MVPAVLSAPISFWGRVVHRSQCEVLCFGEHPSWDDVRGRFIELRDLF
jgi:hypothetical protein